jgi:aspartate-semialdehyde dehydrogenase
MIDNSSAFRMDDDVPLVVPEVNPEDVRTHTAASSPTRTARPSRWSWRSSRCTILRASAGRRRDVPGRLGRWRCGDGRALHQTRSFLEGEETEPEQFAHRIAFNCIPQIDVFLDDGSTKEEWKMVVETKKIMHAPGIEIVATCVRVPVLRCHSEALTSSSSVRSAWTRRAAHSRPLRA